MYRLGHWSEDKARPLLVSLKSADHKNFIVANIRNLRQPIEKFKGIDISHDLHSKEKERKRLIAEAKQDHIANDSDDVGNYRFIVVGNGQRRKVIKKKKQYSSLTSVSNATNLKCLFFNARSIIN